MVSPAATAALFADVEHVGSESLQRVGADWFELLRREKVQALGSDEWHHAVGGGVDLTIIDRSQARTIRLRDWPDRVGEKIAPTSP